MNTVGKILLFLVLAMLTSYMAAASVFIDKVDLGGNVNTNQDLTCKWTLSGSENSYKANVTILKNGQVFKDLQNQDSSKGDNTVSAGAKADTFIGNTWTCRVTATDLKGAVVGPTDSATITITNQVPTWVQSISALTVNENSGDNLFATLNIPAKVKDDDGSNDEQLEFTATSSNADKIACTISIDGQTLKITPVTDAFTSKDGFQVSSPAVCKITVQDRLLSTNSILSTADTTVNVVVNNVNQAPVFSTAATLPAAVVNQTTTVTITASDKDSDKLTFSFDGAAPAFMCPNGVNNCFSAITDNSVTLSFMPTTEGTFNFNIKVTDGKLTATKTFALTVAKAAPPTATSAKYLVFNTISAYVDAKKDKSVDETGGSVDKVRPGSKLRLRVKVENLWTNTDNKHRINNVETAVAIADMGGDTNSQDETLTYKDLDPGDSDTDELTFNIDKTAEEGTYNLKLTLTGRDDTDGTKYEVNQTITVRVEKESHNVDFTRYTVDPSTVTCTRTATLNVELTDLGRNDEDIQYTLKANKELGIEEKIELVKLQEGVLGDDGTTFKKQYTFNIPTNVKPGPYSIDSEVYFDNDQLKQTKSAILVIADCGSTTTTTDNSVAQPKQPVKTQTVDVVTTQNTPSQTPITTPTTAVATLPSQSSGLFDNSGYIVLLVVAIVVVLLVIIFLLVAIARSGRKN